MTISFKKIIVGTVIAGALLSAAGALADDTAAMTKDEAKGIAQASACVKDGTLKGDGFYNEGSKTWWFDLNIEKQGCAPACVVNAVTKSAEINWRCTGLIVPTSKKTVDIACMATAVATREAAISSAFSAKSTAVSAAFTKRASDLAAAWAITTAKDRNAAIKAAWKTFNASAVGARKTYRASIAAAWKTFRTGAKACRGSASQDASAQGTDNNL